MARTVAEMEQDAKALDPAAVLSISAAEAKALVEQHQRARKEQGRPIPDHSYVMNKLRSGKVCIHGHPVTVGE